MAQLTLSMTDNADGATATAAAPEVAFGEEWFVTTWAVDGSFGSGTPLVYGPFDEGETPALALPRKGYYFAQARRTPTTSEQSFSAPVYFQVSDGADAEASQCREALAERVKLLALEGIGNNVYIQLQPTQVNTKFPCVIVTPWGLAQDNPQNLSGLDDWGNPNWVWICDRNPPTLHKELKRIERWRQAIMRACHNQQWPVPRSMVRGVVEPDAIIDPRLPTYQFIVSQMVVRAYTREARGLGA